METNNLLIPLAYGEYGEMSRGVKQEELYPHHEHMNSLGVNVPMWLAGITNPSLQPLPISNISGSSEDFYPNDSDLPSSDGSASSPDTGYASESRFLTDLSDQSRSPESTTTTLLPLETIPDLASFAGDELLFSPPQYIPQPEIDPMIYDYNQDIFGGMAVPDPSAFVGSSSLTRNEFKMSPMMTGAENFVDSDYGDPAMVGMQVEVISDHIEVAAQDSQDGWNCAQLGNDKQKRVRGRPKKPDPPKPLIPIFAAAGKRKQTKAPKTRNGQEPVVCNICQLKSRDNAAHRTHYMVHTGEKPYNCRVPGCDKKFRQNIHRKKHESSPNPLVHIPKPKG